MKKLTTILLIALLPVVALAQSKSVIDFQSKFSSDPDVTTVLIKGPLFKFIASIAELDDNDPEMEAIGRIANGIKSMEVFSVPFYTDLNREDISTLRNELKKDGYEELLFVKEGKDLVNIMSQGKEDEIRNMVILAEEKENFTLLSINGKLSMKDLAYLSKNHDDFH